MREALSTTTNNRENYINDLLNGIGTKREGMFIQNRTDILLKEVIDIKVKTKMLPITMRKLYAYKIASIKEKINTQKVIPLVLRKRMLYESVVNS